MHQCCSMKGNRPERMASSGWYHVAEQLSASPQQLLDITRSPLSILHGSSPLPASHSLTHAGGQHRVQAHPLSAMHSPSSPFIPPSLPPSLPLSPSLPPSLPHSPTMAGGMDPRLSCSKSSTSRKPGLLLARMGVTCSLTCSQMAWGEGGSGAMRASWREERETGRRGREGGEGGREGGRRGGMETGMEGGSRQAGRARNKDADGWEGRQERQVSKQGREEGRHARVERENQAGRKVGTQVQDGVDVRKQLCR